ncbi:MAG: SRPBCC family protein [Nitrospiraceae bacterium]
MHELHHEIQISAPPQTVYEAITTQKGIRSWWTRDSVVQPLVGSVVELGFNNRSLLLRMRIDELRPQKRIVWYCLGPDEEWKDTRLIWEISEKAGATNLHLLHAYWRSPGSTFAIANTQWGELIHRLKDYIEGRNPGPRWKK